MSNEKSKSSWMAAYSVASVWFGTHVGVGFATGNQAIQYYVQYGWIACFLPLLSMGILAIVMNEIMKFAKTRNLNSYKEVFAEMWAPYSKLEITMEIFYVIIILAAVGGAIATAASILESFGISYTIATFIVGAIIVALSIFGVNLILKASAILSIIILIVSFIMYFAGIFEKSGEINQIFATQQASNIGAAIWNSILYNGFQNVSIPAMLAVAMTLNVKGIKRANILGWLMNGLALVVSSLMLLLWYNEISAQGSLALPNLYVCQKMGYSWLYICYSVALFCAVISTDITLVYTMVTKYENAKIFNKIKNNNFKRIIIALIVIIFCMAISFFGLSNLVKYGYGFCGYIGLVFITIPVLTIVRKKNKKYIKEHPESVE